MFHLRADVERVASVELDTDRLHFFFPSLFRPGHGNLCRENRKERIINLEMDEFMIFFRNLGKREHGCCCFLLGAFI